jgi:SAM-dependent methyltransferase
MKNRLVIVGESFPQNAKCPPDAAPDAATIVLRPAGSTFHPGAAADKTFDPPLSIVAHQQLWLPLRDAHFERIDVLGGAALQSSADALAIAAYLTSDFVVFHSGDGQRRDVTARVREMHVDFRAPRAMTWPLAPSEEAAFKADMHRHYLASVAANDFQLPQNRNVQTTALDHFQKRVGLAQDLMMRVPEICENPWWSLGLQPDGRLVRTVDHRLAYATFLEQLDGVGSCLEVGCGSGFLPIFLGLRGRFGRVAGIDAVENRVAGARLLARLANADIELATAGADRLPFQNDEFDLVFTCFTLEQCQDILDSALDEIFRVAARYAVLFEPSIEAFPTLPGLVHIGQHGFPTTILERLQQRGMAFSIVRPALRHYYNPGAMFVVSIESSVPWHVASRPARGAAA